MAFSLSRMTRTLRKGFVPYAQSVFASMFGGAGAGVREPYAGAWQNGGEIRTSQRKSPLAHSAVYTCINIISSDISKLPMKVKRPRVGAPGMEDHVNHPINRVLRNPNRYQTALQFLLYYFASKLWTGNVYVLLFRDSRGVVESMHVLDPSTVTPAVTKEGDVWYLVKANDLNKLAEDTYIPARDVLHDRAMALFHPLIGVSPLYAAAVSANIGNSISSNSEQFFENMSRASGVLTAPGDIPPATADRLKKEWDGNYSGLGFGKVAVLGAGLEWKPLAITAADAQLIEQLRFTVEDIGRVYRVPSFMLGELAKQTYRNSEQSARMYYQGCLSHHIESAEQCFTAKFEMEGGVRVMFDLSPLFRMESDVRYETHAKALSAGIKSINEVRAEEDLPPVKGGEEPRMQVQYVPISMTPMPGQPGATPTPAVPADPEDDTPDDDVDSENDDDGNGDAEDTKQVTEESLAVVRAKLLGMVAASVV